MSEPSHQDRLDALWADYYEARERGQTTPDIIEEIGRRHPDLVAEFRTRVEKVEAVQPLLKPLRELMGSLPSPPPLPEVTMFSVKGF